MTSFNIYEAYAAVYNEDLREELLIEETILLESIEELYDDELEEIVEDSIYSMLDEGYDIDEVEEIFEEVLSEARLSAAARAAAVKRDEESATAARSRGASVVRKEKRAEVIGRIKGAVKKVASDVKSAVKKTAGDIKSGAKEAKFKAVDAPAARYATKRGIGGPGPGLSARSKDPEKRRALRGAVVSDLTSRAKAKLGRGAEKVRSAGEKAVGAVKSSSDAAQGKMRSAGSAVKKGAKGLVGGAARAVSRGARDVARRLGEDVDLYDVVLEHLLDEGFADTEDAATVIMANMSEEWREEIIDEANRGDEYEASKTHPSLARSAKQKRRNASFDSGATHPRAPRMTSGQQSEIENMPNGGAAEVSRQKTQMRQRYTSNTRGIKPKR